jgi:tetratricopeptide (TPR) repeat protein
MNENQDGKNSENRTQAKVWYKDPNWILALVGIGGLFVGMLTWLFGGSGVLNNLKFDKPAQADVTIAEFEDLSSQKVKISYRLKDAIYKKLTEAGLDNVTVIVDSKKVSNENEANALAKDRKSKVVIWGWQDQVGISVRIFLAEENQFKRDIPGVKLPIETAGNPETQIEIVADKILPENIAFLSLFIIGRLKYNKNNYEEGLKAFNLAMESQPKGIRLENESLIRSLVHFFSARQFQNTTLSRIRNSYSKELKSRNYANLTNAVCEYTKAIKLNRSFAEAYNNLGSIFAQYTNEFGDVVLPEEVRAAYKPCLNDSQIKTDTPKVLFDTALKLQPGWALPEYNRLILDWEWGGEKRSWTFLKNKFEMLLKRDSSLFGAYIALANISFR